MCAEVGSVRVRALPEVDWDAPEYPELKWACKAANVWRQRNEAGTHHVYVLHCESCMAAWCERRPGASYTVATSPPA